MWVRSDVCYTHIVVTAYVTYSSERDYPTTSGTAAFPYLHRSAPLLGQAQL